MRKVTIAAEPGRRNSNIKGMGAPDVEASGAPVSSASWKTAFYFFSDSGIWMSWPVAEPVPPRSSRGLPPGPPGVG